MTRQETIAAALANARGARHGVPAITNILGALPADLRAEVMEEAAAVEEALAAVGGESHPDLFAWMGMDKLGTGRVGIKASVVPAGYIPLVGAAFHRHKMEKLRDQMQAQADAYGVTIRLVRYTPAEAVIELPSIKRERKGGAGAVRLLRP